MKRNSRLTSLLLYLTVLTASFGANSPPHATAPPVAPVGSFVDLSCTVRALDAKTRTLEVITGVGYSLRLYRMKVAPDCETRIGGEGAAIGELKPGMIVRVRYQVAPSRLNAPAEAIAVAIEDLRIREGGGTR